MASSSLLSSIEGFSKNKLKKTVTIDKSAPLIPQNKTTEVAQSNNGPESSAGGGGSSTYSQPPPMMTGGLFAGGIPTLRKTGRAGAATMLGNAQAAPSSATPAPSQPPPPLAKPANLEKEINAQQAPAPPSQPAPSQPPSIPSTPAPSQPPPPLAKPANLENEIKSQYAPPIPSQPAPAHVPVVPVVPIQPAAPVRAAAPPVQAPAFTQPAYNQGNYNTSYQSDQSRKESILPSIAFKIPSADDIDIEAHPAIPSFQNPLLNTIISNSKQIQRTPKQEQAAPKMEEPIPEVESFESVAALVPEPAPQAAPLDPSVEKKKAKELKKIEFLQKIRQGDTDAAVDILQSEITQAKRKKFLNTLVFDEQSKIKTTALHVSIESGNPALMATLLAQGADTLLPDGAGTASFLFFPLLLLFPSPFISPFLLFLFHSSFFFLFLPPSNALFSFLNCFPPLPFPPLLPPSLLPSLFPFYVFTCFFISHFFNGGIPFIYPSPYILFEIVYLGEGGSEGIFGKAKYFVPFIFPFLPQIYQMLWRHSPIPILSYLFIWI